MAFRCCLYQLIRLTNGRRSWVGICLNQLSHSLAQEIILWNALGRCALDHSPHRVGLGILQAHQAGFKAQAIVEWMQEAPASKGWHEMLHHSFWP